MRTDATSHGKSLRRFKKVRGATPLWLAGGIAVLSLIVAGSVYRDRSARLDRLPPVSLPVPLESLPLEMGEWEGQPLEIEATTRQYMEAHFADDYVSRRYVKSAEGMWADLYVVYCSTRLAGLTGHQPRVCYPGNGWIWDETVESEIVSDSGRRIPCLVHRFHKPLPDYREVVVLNFYVLNGQITLDEREFSDLWGRRLNLQGDYARYVAQIQVSSTHEGSIRSALSSMVDTILTFLPDRDGNVQAAYSAAAEEADTSRD